ncbi:MAG: hypothetical protein M3134_11895 [Actinomycetota bacterium]|nr:hypothetical protein [Actinomycetota bacterium]
MVTRDQSPEPTDKLTRAPISWHLWRNAMAGKPAGDGWEVTFFSDAWVLDEIRGGMGPYQLLNLVSRMAKPAHGEAEPAVALRVLEHGADELEQLALAPLGEKVQKGSYHGGSLADEIAALVSLLAGVRCQAGPVSRRYLAGGDPAGSPTWDSTQVPKLIGPPPGWRPRLPSISLELNLGELREPLSRYPRLSAGNARELIRAARLHQEATWNADADPQLAWLQIVGAVEVAAERWRGPKTGAVARVRSADPVLAEILDRATPSVREAVAEHLQGTLSSTSRFVRFMKEFAPPPRRPRPPRPYRLDRRRLTTSMRAIYARRSEALHGGVPIPFPMCEAPAVDKRGRIPERTPALGSGTWDASWPADATPMYLNTFAELARGALLAWWESLPLESEPGIRRTRSRSKPKPRTKS